MKAPNILPETVSEATPKSKSGHVRMLDGFTSVLLGSDAYFAEIDAQVDRAIAMQKEPR
jgi:hypothetical protein